MKNYEQLTHNLQLKVLQFRIAPSSISDDGVGDRARFMIMGHDHEGSVFTNGKIAKPL
jgi:hypothetical protein